MHRYKGVYILIIEMAIFIPVRFISFMDGSDHIPYDEQTSYNEDMNDYSFGDSNLSYKDQFVLIFYYLYIIYWINIILLI